MKLTPKTTGWIGFALFIFITFIFILGEHKNFNKHSDFDVKIWTNYFTSIGSMGTALTVIYFSFQLQEMKDARNAQIKPWISIRDFYFDVEEQEISNGGETGTVILPKTYLINPDQGQLIEVFNKGRGLARDIKCNWEFSFEEIEKLKPKNISIYGSLLPSSQINDLNINDSTLIGVPLNYLACCAPSINTSWFANPDESEQTKPELNLTIKYFDIDGREYTKKYQVKVDALGHTVYFNFIES